MYMFPTRMDLFLMPNDISSGSLMGLFLMRMDLSMTLNKICTGWLMDLLPDT